MPSKGWSAAPLRLSVARGQTARGRVRRSRRILPVAVVLASYSGFPHVWRLVQSRHNWPWLLGCLIGELVAYGGYVLTLRDMARVDEGNEVDLKVSAKTVVAGFGVFAATRSSGGFAVDYWAFREAGSSRHDAVRRVVRLGLLEYVVLSIAALGASALLFFGLDGHAGNGVTLPSLVIVPALGIGFWLTPPERAERLSRRRSGFGRRLFADTVAGAATVRRLFDPARHGLGVLGNALYWFGDIFCLWAALQFVGVQISASLLVLAYSGAYVFTRRALPAGGAGVVELALAVRLWNGRPVHTRTGRRPGLPPFQLLAPDRPCSRADARYPRPSGTLPQGRGRPRPKGSSRPARDDFESGVTGRSRRSNAGCLFLPESGPWIWAALAVTVHLIAGCNFILSPPVSSRPPR